MSRGKCDVLALSRLFSPSIVRDFGRWGRSPNFARLAASADLSWLRLSAASVGDVFDEAFGMLKQIGRRDEYIYRAAITQKLLLGRHSLATAAILNEIRAGSSKADVVVLNGTAAAYEIKSERDSLSRLRNQLHDYLRVFASVNVVASPSHVKDVLAHVPSEVGVLTLSGRFTLQTEQPAKDDPSRISPLSVLEVLRVDEAVSVLNALGKEIPAVPNTMIRGALKEQFCTLDPAAVHEQMVAVLKVSRSQSDLSQSIHHIPNSLRAAYLGVRPNGKSQILIKEAVETPLIEALAWK